MDEVGGAAPAPFVQALSGGPGEAATALLEALGACSALDVLTMASWAAIALFVWVEVSVLSRRHPWDRVRLAGQSRESACMATGALAVGVVYGALFALLWRAVSGLAPAGLPGWWDRHPVAAALSAFVLWDLSGWVYHLLGHRTRLGWAAHSPHHAGTGFDASIALRLTWMPWHGLLHHPLIALTGLRLEVVLVCLAVSNLLQAVQHSALLPQPPRWIASVVMTPGSHLHHHGPDGAGCNLGPVLTLWDRLAGTWVPPDPGPDARRTEPHRGGAPARRGPHRGVRSALASELAGWGELAGVRFPARSDPLA